MGIGSIAKGIVKAVISPVRIVTSIFKMNPKLAILAIAATWLFGSLLRKQDNPDFGDTEFDNFEKGILINKTKLNKPECLCKGLNSYFF